MIKKTYTEEVVATIRNSLPPNEKIVSFLSDLFCWNKEAIYRRLRGEIAFTFEEIIQIADKLDFSIDSIIRFNQTERIVFNLLLQESTSATDLYCEKRDQLVALSDQVSKSANSESLFAINYLPFSFITYLESLSVFVYYKWMHQTQSLPSDAKICDLVLPQRIKDMRETYVKQERGNSVATFILDSNVFLSVIKDIEYFYKRKLISKQELSELRQELLQLVDSLVELARTGKAYAGEKIQMYLSPIDIATNHFYIEYDDNACCYVEVYGIDILQSCYPEASQAQKEWIENYKRYSTLITQSAEMECYNYFDKQRAYILNMGQNNDLLY